jgi:hypothetical protein
MFSRKGALLFVIAIAVGPSCAGGGCSPSEEEEPRAVDCSSCPLDFTTSGTVSFQNDLFKDADPVGIFRRACNLGSTCHGTNPGAKAGLYLGPSGGPMSACGADTGAAACTAGGTDCGGRDDRCLDQKRACTCGTQHCATELQRCIADPTTGESTCGPPTAGAVCASDADCNGGAAGTCVDPEPTCVCGDDVCTTPGQRCAPTPVDTDTALKASIINGLMRASKTFPSMPIITPNDPKNSFLMWKVDGCQSCSGKLASRNCAQGETGDCCSVQSGALPGNSLCGDSMPRGSDILSEAERDKIRLWIAQGAQNN